MEKKTLLSIGVLLLIAGIATIAYAMGFFGFSAVRVAAVVPQGKISGQIGTFKSFFPLSVVVPGGSYEWRVVVKNTGDVKWDNFQVIVVLEQDGSRVDITNWAFKWREDSTWKSGDCVGGSAAACSFPTTLTPLDAGQTKTYHIRLTIPGDAYGTYTLKVMLNAAVGSVVYSNIASKTDTLNIGSISGDITLTFIGALSLVGGLAAIIAGIKKP